MQVTLNDYQLNSFGAFQDSLIPKEALIQLQNLAHVCRQEDIDKIKKNLNKRFQDDFTADQVFAYALLECKWSDIEVVANFIYTKTEHFQAQMMVI